jgi:hypothetical protein
LVQYGFVKDYTIWKYHGEGDPSATGASEGNSSTTSTAAVVNDGGQQPSSLAGSASGDSSNHDYININDFLHDMANNNGGGDGEQDDALEPDDVELFQYLANRMD